MSTHNDKNKDDIMNPPRNRPKIHMPKPARPTPRREGQRDEGRAALTPPPHKKDERVVR